MSEIEKIIVIDTETNGLPEDNAALLEAAWVVVEKVDGQWAVTHGQGTTIRYDGPLDPVARAVHHLGPEDVGPDSTAIDHETLLHSLLAAEEPGAMMYAAHNAAFDKAFLPELTLPWIDTYQCSKHLVPDAPKHSNQVLRYYLGLEPKAEFLEGLSSHRALYDTAVTGELLVYLLNLAPPEELLRLTDTPILQTVCNFGKAHTGKLWSEVPWSYLDWILNKSDVPNDPVGNKDLIYTVRHWYDKR